MILRKIDDLIKSDMFSGKAIVIMGARQVGKTTTVRNISGNADDIVWFNADEPDVRDVFANITSTRIAQLVGNKKVIVIDEAQRITDIGVKLKLITDCLPDHQLIVTGSSSFELANMINEPLTGRKWEYTMYPLMFSEMVAHHGLLAEKRAIPHRLVYGYYPDVVSDANRAERIVRGLADSYIYKDVLMFDRMKKTDGLMKMLQAIAFQVGSEVSYNEISQLCGIDSKTVEKYIGIMEQAFIIFRLPSFSRNLRNELKKSRKIYFWDNGIRNAVISNFSPIEVRADAGQLFENFAISERLKMTHTMQMFRNNWFWRTTAQQEIDLLEENDGQLSAYEFKYSIHKKARVPLTFANAYPDAQFSVISMDNIDEFLL